MIDLQPNPSHRIHVHFSEVIIPKDGPSAGLAIASALISLAENKTPKANFSMTGEISLKGKAMIIGGVKEKVISSKREGNHNIILPFPNKPDFEKLPDYVKQDLNVTFVKNYQDVFNTLFEN